MIDEEKKILEKDLFNSIKENSWKELLMPKEDYASSFGKNQSIKNDSIKRKERIKNIDLEVENWRKLNQILKK